MNKQEIAAGLQALLKMPVLMDEPMRSHTTWRIGGPADYFVTPDSEEELAAVLRFAYKEELPWLVIGNGSNLLVGDKGVRGIVIKMGEPFSKAVWRGKDVEVMAGKLLAPLALEAAERSLTGLEFARGIPGSMGGGIRMNAGAYGNTLGEFVTKIEAVDYRGEKVVLSKEEVTFAYRNSSLFDMDIVVTRVHLHLEEGDREESMQKMKDFLQRRSFAQPLEFPSCGSVFRNPPGDHAGHLVELTGLRGTGIGNVEVSAKHGNFIINRGNGRAEDVRALIELVQERVYAYSGIHLEPEVKFVGEF